LQALKALSRVCEPEYPLFLSSTIAQWIQWIGVGIFGFEQTS